LELRIKEREQTNAELEAFSYSVSHDLRAPLRAIEGYSDIIQEEFGDKLPVEAKQYLQEIINSTGRMNRLVQDLLNYSRLSRVDLKSEPVGVESVITDACGELDQQLRSRTSVSVEPKLRVKAHGAMLRQVISNLLSNAAKFTKPEASPNIGIRAFKSGRSVAIQVKDEGIGIAPQHQERIFQVFERLHGADEYPGTGIGLAIVKRAVNRMGGTIGLDSELGKGSTFTIMLPAV
jgi:signal transduction histidine kinase